MAGDSQAVKISGLDVVDPAKTDATTCAIPGNDVDKNTKRWSPRAITDAAGDVKHVGDVASSGKLGDTITTTIQPGAVTLAKQANMPQTRLIGRTSAGVGPPEHIAVGAGLTLVDGVLTASAPASADASTAALTRKFFHGF